MITGMMNHFIYHISYITTTTTTTTTIGEVLDLVLFIWTRGFTPQRVPEVRITILLDTVVKSIRNAQALKQHLVGQGDCQIYHN
jgi:hypothetical protein